MRSLTWIFSDTFAGIPKNFPASTPGATKKSHRILGQFAVGITEIAVGIIPRKSVKKIISEGSLQKLLFRKPGKSSESSHGKNS